MISDSINGVFVIAVGGVANGSFPVPAKRIQLWKWEHIWLIYSAFAMGILPIGLALAFAPQIIRQTLIRDPYLTAQVGGCGLLFGAGSVFFGVSLGYERFDEHCKRHGRHPREEQQNKSGVNRL